MARPVCVVDPIPGRCAHPAPDLAARLRRVYAEGRWEVRVSGRTADGALVVDGAEWRGRLSPADVAAVLRALAAGRTAARQRGSRPTGNGLSRAIGVPARSMPTGTAAGGLEPTAAVHQSRTKEVGA